MSSLGAESSVPSHLLLDIIVFGFIDISNNPLSLDAKCVFFFSLSIPLVNYVIKN